MAMLAGPRRKQKVINLRAKSNAWSNDASKFGQRMLEKMGWSSGKGLGAKENGIVDHVVARYKNDDRGLGFEDKNDQWTKHEDDFNALLANLSSGDKKDEKLHSGISLEDKSKKSKARVHYHKFTRGKDLTKYSEKDLANIFGKKSFKNEEKPEEVLKDDVVATEQVFTEKGSMEDYFKSKLAAFKSQNKSIYNKISEKEDGAADYGFQGFSGIHDDESENHKGFGFQSFNSNDNEEKDSINDTVPEDTASTENPKKNKKKKKKQKFQDEELLIQENNCDNVNSEDCTINIDTSNVTDGQNIKSKKKKRKDKGQEEMVETIKSKEDQHNDETIVAIEPVIENKKHKKKKKDLKEIEQVTEDYHVPKKKKKRKCVDSEN